MVTEAGFALVCPSLQKNNILLYLYWSIELATKYLIYNRHLSNKNAINWIKETLPTAFVVHHLRAMELIESERPQITILQWS